MRRSNVLPWLDCEKCKGDIDSSMLAQHNRNSFDALAILLADIEGSTLEKQRIVEVFGPRAAVFHGQGEPAYLFRYQSPYGFASFALDTRSILTVRPRYNDAMDPKSGRRKSNTLLSGWQGVAEILESAVRHSSNWKYLQTIETDATPPSGWDDARATYEIWATPRNTRVIEWCAEKDMDAGIVVMPKSQPVLLARATVSIRPQDSGFTIEEVINLELYPQFAGNMSYGCDCVSGEVYRNSPGIHNCNWRNQIAYDTCHSHAMMPVLVDMRHERVMRFQPHDELKLTLNWK